MKQTYCLLLLFIYFLSSCNNKLNENEQLKLKKSEKSIKELNLVLNHYSKHKKDSLKYKAAEYLLENMQYHYSTYKTINTPDYIKLTFSKVNNLTKDNFYDLNKQFTIEDSLVFEESIDQIVLDLLNRNKKINQPYGKFFDIDEVKSLWLIEHIDNAFDVWQNSPYANNIDYREFCETILRYRFKYEALDLSSKIYRETFYDIIHFNNPNTIEEVVKQFNNYTFYADIFEDDGELLGSIGMYDILQLYKYTCERHSEWTARVLNSCGIPTTFDFTTGWQDRRWGHYWVSVRSKSGRYYPFTPKWQELHDTTYFSQVSKVYRRTYDVQEGPKVNKLGKANIPSQFRTNYIKDVTDEYHNVFDLTIPFNGNTKDLEFAYICIFTSQGWKPVGWGKLNDNGKNIQFNKVPQNITFILATYQNNKITPFSQPFYVNSFGEMREIVPNYDLPESILITRKFHKKDKMVKMAEDMVGSIIEGSNNRDFNNARILYVLQQNDLSDLVVKRIELQDPSKYRYLRIKAKNTNDLNLAIFEVYSQEKEELNKNIIQTLPFTLPKGGTKTIKNYYKIPITVINDTTDFKNIFDGNLETYLTTKLLEIDLGAKRNIKQIRMAPRNANNHIVIGDNYELLFFDKEWISTGVKSSTKNYLIYKDIPSGALLWIKDLDHGKEEQSFIYHNQKQVFVNHDKISDFVY